MLFATIFVLILIHLSVSYVNQWNVIFCVLIPENNNNINLLQRRRRRRLARSVQQETTFWNTSSYQIF